MNDAELTLWQRLEALSLDDPQAAVPFSARLARENGWTLRHAQRVVNEYKRFVFLTATMPTPACPSEAVDEAWHLHLCYTRSYWKELCHEVLGQPLHHEPTRGGGGQFAHHRAMYEQTLTAYRAAFGVEPPPSIWPPTDERFPGGSTRHVDAARHWVIPKPSLRRVRSAWRRMRGALTLLGGIAIVPVLGADWPLFDMAGPTFIAFYISALAVAVVLGLIVRGSKRAPDDGSPPPDLGTYQIAVLAGGEALAARTALTELVLSKKVEADKDGVESVEPPVDSPQSRGVSPVVHAAHVAVASNPKAKYQDLQRGVQAAAAKIAVELEDLGLLETNDSFRPARWAPVKLLLVVLAVGVVKFLVGVARGKPVGFLIALCVVTLVAIGLFWVKPKRTPRGERVLAALKKSRENLKQPAALWQAPMDMQVMGIALFGIGALAATDGNKDLHRWLAPPGSGGGCSGGGGGGDGGGGGCGGGGCGGCGGD